MSRAIALIVLTALLAACGGPQASASPTPGTTTPTPTATPGMTASGATGLTPEALCNFLLPTDWQQFNYVTTAQPEVTSDAPGTAICYYARTLYFEIYVDETPGDAEATYDTIIENAPFDAGEQVTIAGADEAEIDMEITGVEDDTSGIVVRTGRVTFTIGGPARDEARAQLQTLAETVVQRVASLR